MVLKMLNCRQQRTVIFERWESVGEPSLLQKNFQNVALGGGGCWCVLEKSRGLPSRPDGAENSDVKVATVFRPRGGESWQRKKSTDLQFPL